MLGAESGFPRTRTLGPLGDSSPASRAAVGTGSAQFFVWVSCPVVGGGGRDRGTGVAAASALLLSVVRPCSGLGSLVDFADLGDADFSSQGGEGQR